MSKKNQQHRPPLIIALTVALALLLAWPAWIAARIGLSDIYARPAIDYLEEKRFDRYQLSDEEWQAIQQAVAQADHLMPGNPQYLESMGWLHQIKLSLFADELSIEEMDAHAKAARHYFQRAVENRPTWPYYWGNLALEHYRRGNYSTADYNKALANAARFGPWKKDTQRLVADLGSDTWEFLSADARREIILNIERALNSQPEYIVQLVQDAGGWIDVCDASETLPGVTIPHLQSICAQNRIVGEAPRLEPSSRQP